MLNGLCRSHAVRRQLHVTLPRRHGQRRLSVYLLLQTDRQTDGRTAL